MPSMLKNAAVDVPEEARTGLPLGIGARENRALSNRQGSRLACFHCGEPCPDERFSKLDKIFCCQGCQFVHELLIENGLERFYDLDAHPGVRVKKVAADEAWLFLDDSSVQSKLLDFSDGKT